MKLGQMAMQGLPMTDEVAAAAKKKRLEAGQETTDLSQAQDLYQPSEAAASLGRPKVDQFLEDIRADLEAMDKNSETFLPDATSALISRAFGHEFGEEFTTDPGYSQMEAVLARQLLSNPEYRDTVEAFISKLTQAHESVGSLIEPVEGEGSKDEEEEES
jgi:hypothetical protein